MGCCLTFINQFYERSESHILRAIEQGEPFLSDNEINHLYRHRYKPLFKAIKKGGSCDMSQHYRDGLFIRFNVIGTYKEENVIIFQFSDCNVVYIVFAYNNTFYETIETCLERWNKVDLLHQGGHQLLITLFRETNSIDNLCFVHNMEIKESHTSIVTEIPLDL